MRPRILVQKLFIFYVPSLVVLFFSLQFHLLALPPPSTFLLCLISLFILRLWWLIFFTRLSGEFFFPSLSLYIYLSIYIYIYIYNFSLRFRGSAVVFFPSPFYLLFFSLIFCSKFCRETVDFFNLEDHASYK